MVTTSPNRGFFISNLVIFFVDLVNGFVYYRHIKTTGITEMSLQRTALLTQNQNFQFEQALACVAHCNMADVSFSSLGENLFCSFCNGSERITMPVDRDGEYWSFMEDISRACK